MIIGTSANKLQFIIRDFKAFTSRSFKEVIAEHPKESRKNWIMWMMERVGKEIATIITGNFGSRTATR